MYIVAWRIFVLFLPAACDAAKLMTSVRYGSVGDIQANLERADKSQLRVRDREGASLLMHAALRGDAKVFRAVLDFLSEKLFPNEASGVEMFACSEGACCLFCCV